eukprot:gnl/MRDRNA2_/MRDRNA2_123042_c0_seq1.p1 gnl/MRDRNA2_/MRDRNA2_123042_c0~~gnl/MRDRNA2_/MRDRNA2_123042_c0_seq1.p1  ORF type:complete len:238 (-),score=70.62 gnl/MRDRNA2_/MRDRNA2_123042_c0_seq1:42-755(-)
MSTQLQDQPQAAQTSLEILMKASNKLEEAMKEVGSPNEFAILLQELLEVSTKVAQFNEMAFVAEQAAISEEAQTWKEISMMTLQHCRTQLVDRQRSLIEQLQVLAEEGASLSRSVAPPTLTTGAEVASKVESTHASGSPPPGLPSVPTCAYPSPIQFDGSSSKKAAAPIMRAPPGLDHPSRTPKTPPPGFRPQDPQLKASKIKQETSAKIANQKQVAALAEPARSSPMLNVDAYDSN